MSVNFGFSLPALRQAGAGSNPFGQLGPTLDLSFAGTVTDTNNPNGYTLNTNFITPEYQVAAQYAIWEDGVGLSQKTFSQIVTFTRASTGTYFNSAGTLTTAAINEARFDFNPSTLAAQGFLIEESRTNSIRNNTMVGAVAGTPGTLPTNWSVSGLGTLTQEVVGTGTSNGITYIDIRFSGTTSTTQLVVRFDNTGVIAAANGQSWALSAWLAVVGGSTANTNTYTLSNNLFDSGNVYIGEGPSTTLASPPTSTFTRYAAAGTISNASTASIRPYFYVLFASGVAVDFTLRVGLPQLELGAFATSVIPTTTTALTRSADVALVNTLSPWYNASAGTLYAEVMLYALPSASTFPAYADINNGSTNERFALSSNQFANHRVTVRSTAGVIWDTNAGGALVANVTSKWALAATSGDQAASANGAAAAVNSTAGMPAGLTTLRIGSAAGTNQASGWIRRITYYPRRLSNAELQAITA